MRWTEEEARSHGFIQDADGNWHRGKKAKASRKNHDSAKVPKPQHSIRRFLEGTHCGEKRLQSRCEIRVLCYTRRNTDPDNLCPKTFIDELIKLRWITDDSSKFISRVTKEVVKVKREDEEKTVIEIWQELEEESEWNSRNSSI